MQQGNPFDQFDDPFPTVVSRRDPLDLRRENRADRGEQRADANEYRDRRRDDLTLNADVRKANAEAAAAERALREKPSDEQFKRAADLRSQYLALPSVKAYNAALSTYASGLKSSATGAGDLLLINSFAKVMDPTSAVMEGEARNVQTGDSWVNATIASMKNALAQNGGKFSPQYRQQLRAQMATRLGELNRSFIADRVNFKGIADRAGIPSIDVVGEHPGERFQELSEKAFGQPRKELDYYGNEIATGATRTERDADASAMIDMMIRRGASADQINAALKPLGIDPVGAGDVAKAQAFIRANPSYKGSLGEATRSVPQTAANRFSGSSLGAGIGGYINGAMGGFLDEAVGGVNAAFTGVPLDKAIAEADAKKQAANNAFPMASLAGNALGGVTTALAGGGLANAAGLTAKLGGRAALAGDVALGAFTGAGENNSNRLLGAGISALGGAGGGFIGRQIAPVAGAAIGGLKAPTVRALRDRGIPLTVGQIAGDTGVVGRGLKRIEDNLTGFPLVGDAINARRREGFEAFNRAAFDDALAPINASTNGVVGEAGVDAALDATKQGYRTALDGVSVTRDPQFTGEYNAALAKGAQVPRVGPEFDAWANATLDPLTSQPQFNGGVIQDFLQQTKAADFGTDAMGSLVGKSITSAEDAMRGLVGRQAPGVLPALGNADTAFRQTQILRDGVNRARNGSGSGDLGVFTPAQLADAAAANAKRFGGTQGTTAQPFFDLTRAGQSVLPSKVADSGTASRFVTGALAAGGLGAGAGYATDNPGTGTASGLAAALALAAGGSKTVQRAIGAALLERPALAMQIGDEVAKQSRLTGMFGRGFGVAAAPRLLPQ